MGKQTINDLKSHDFNTIAESPYEVNVIRSGKINFNGTITTNRLVLTVSTSGQIHFNEACNVSESIELNISTTAGIWMNSIKSGNLNATIHTGTIHLTYQNDKSENGNRIDIVTNLKNYGQLYIKIPKDRSVHFLGMDDFGNVNWHNVAQTSLEEADYYILASGRASAFLDVNYSD